MWCLEKCSGRTNAAPMRLASRSNFVAFALVAPSLPNAPSSKSSARYLKAESGLRAASRSAFSLRKGVIKELMAVQKSRSQPDHEPVTLPPSDAQCIGPKPHGKTDPTSRRRPEVNSEGGVGGP